MRGRKRAAAGKISRFPIIPSAARADLCVLPSRQPAAVRVFFINPVRFTGLLLAGSVKGAHIADYLADLASVGGRVQLVERAVSAEECGRSIYELGSDGKGLRVYRNGRPIGFWEPEFQTLQPGDVVVEIVPTASGEAGGICGYGSALL